MSFYMSQDHSPAIREGCFVADSPTEKRCMPAPPEGNSTPSITNSDELRLEDDMMQKVAGKKKWVEDENKTEGKVQEARIIA